MQKAIGFLAMLVLGLCLRTSEKRDPMAVWNLPAWRRATKSFLIGFISETSTVCTRFWAIEAGKNMKEAIGKKIWK